MKKVNDSAEKQELPNCFTGCNNVFFSCLLLAQQALTSTLNRIFAFRYFILQYPVIL